MGFDAVGIARKSIGIFLSRPAVVLPLLLALAISTAFGIMLAPPDVKEGATFLQLMEALSVYLVSSGLSFLVSVFFYLAATKMAFNALKAQPSFSAAVRLAPSAYLAFLILTAVDFVVLFIMLLALFGAGAGSIMLASVKLAPVFGLLLFAGSLAVLVAMTIVLLRLSLTTYFAAIGGKGVIDSLKLSWEATKGNALSLLLLVVILIAASVLANAIVWAGFGLTTGDFSRFVATKDPASPTLRNYADDIASTIVMAWGFVVFAMMYVELKKGSESQKRRK